MNDKVYEYKGRAKITEQIFNNTKSNHLIKDYNFIIIANKYFRNLKTQGSPLLIKQFGDSMLSLFIDVINSICENPTIIVVAGCDAVKIMRNKRISECVFIENQLGELTNSGQDLKIGIFASNPKNTILLDSHLLPSYNLIKSLIFDKTTSSLMYYVNDTHDTIGCEINSDGIITNYAFKSNNKLLGATFLIKKDVERLRRKITGSTFSKSKFDFELFDDIKITAIENTSVSYRMDHDKDK